MGELRAGGAWSGIAFGVANGNTRRGRRLGFGCKLLSCHFCWLQRLLSACSTQPLVRAADSPVQRCGGDMIRPCGACWPILHECCGGAPLDIPGQLLDTVKPLPSACCPTLQEGCVHSRCSPACAKLLDSLQSC